jgi:hypothetical protein
LTEKEIVFLWLVRHGTISKNKAKKGGNKNMGQTDIVIVVVGICTSLTSLLLD